MWWVVVGTYFSVQLKSRPSWTICLVKIGSITSYIILTLSLWWAEGVVGVVGGWWWWVSKSFSCQTQCSVEFKLSWVFLKLNLNQTVLHWIFRDIKSKSSNFIFYFLGVWKGLRYPLPLTPLWCSCVFVGCNCPTSSLPSHIQYNMQVSGPGYYRYIL